MVSYLFCLNKKGRKNMATIEHIVEHSAEAKLKMRKYIRIIKIVFICILNMSEKKMMVYIRLLFQK